MKYSHFHRSSASERFRRLRRDAREHGLRYVLSSAVPTASAGTRRTARGLEARARWALLSRRPAETFAFEGRDYRYFRHPYNTTWRNERAVEIPIVLGAIDEARGGRILEVGNVLGHYGVSGHDVVDKYEPAAGVVNVDILHFCPAGRYDLIISVSTLEHVGWDDDERDPSKIPRAVSHLRELLAPGGRALVTVPVGYNPHLDQMLRAGTLGFEYEHWLLRVGECDWREVPESSVGETVYGTPFPAANALVVAAFN